MFLSLAILRLRGLLQRRASLDDARRLRDWQRMLTQSLVSFLMIGIVVAVIMGRISPRLPFELFGETIVLIIIVVRATTRRIPAFLSAKAE